MKPPPFAYADPRSLPDALALLAEHGDACKVLAGGQSLVPLLNMRLAQPDVLIDINRIPQLQYIRHEERHGVMGLAVGAMTRQRAIERMAVDGSPLLREAIGWVGHQQIRNRGTIGGSIAHADPSAELPLVFLGLDGIATVLSNGTRHEVRADGFFQASFTATLEPDELLAEVWLPLPPVRTGQAFLEVARRHGDFALVAVATSLTLDRSGRVDDVRIAMAGAAPVPIRAAKAESVMRGERPALTFFRRAGEVAASETKPVTDMHADAAYRREVAGTLVTRALTLAWERVPRIES